MSKIFAKWVSLDANSLQDNGSGGLSVKLVSGGGIESTASGLQIAAGEVTDAMLAGSISFSKLADSANIARLDQAETVAAVWDFGSNLPTASVNPTSDNELVRKAYVDAISVGLTLETPVRVATTAALPSSPTYANGTAGVGATLTSTGGGTSLNTAGIDGLTDLDIGERILVKDQAAFAENGIYEVTAVGADGSAEYVLTRVTDFDEGSDIVDGSHLFVEEGTAYGDAGFVQTESVTTMGTDAISFTQFTGAGQITAGNGITKTGNILSVDSDTETGGDIQGVNVTATGVGVDIAAIAGTGLEADGSANLRLATQGNGIAGGNGSILSVDPDATTGGDTAAVTVGVNGVGVDVTSLDGDHLTVDFTPSNYTPDASPAEAADVDDLAAHLKGIDTALGATDNVVKIMHKVTSGEVAAGYLTLATNPVSSSSVSVTPVHGPQQVNKQIVGATGVTPDFDVLSTNQVHFNNNGAATGLTEEIEEDDVLIIEYES